MIMTRKKANKTDYNTKIVEIEKKLPDHNKYITIPKFNKLTK